MYCTLIQLDNFKIQKGNKIELFKRGKNFKIDLCKKIKPEGGKLK